MTHYDRYVRLKAAITYHRNAARVGAECLREVHRKHAKIASDDMDRLRTDVLNFIEGMV